MPGRATGLWTMALPGAELVTGPPGRQVTQEEGREMTVLGNSDLDVFPLGLGGNTFGWTSDKETSFAVLDAYQAGGGNFIDTADAYSAWVPGNSGGESETIIGEWHTARGNRDSVVIATKVDRHPQFRGLARANVLAARPAAARAVTRTSGAAMLGIGAVLLVERLATL